MKRERPARPANPFRTDDGVLVIAHRGGSLLWPENTLAAFTGAVALGVDVLELDIHTSRDGELVVIHDASVDRVTEGSGAVRDLDLARLRELDAGYRWTPDGQSFPFRGQGLRIPTLAEVAAAAPDHWLNIDIKRHDPETVTLLVDFIRAHGLEERVLIGSFDDRTVDRFRRLCPEVATAARAGEAWRLFLLHKLRLARLHRRGDARALQIPANHGGREIVSARLVRDAHAHGLAVHVWTINDREEMTRLIALGVDGIVTDRPDLLLEIRNV